ncbi:DUF4215 domain-containing protein [Nannocystis bainbridge]|uniref:DUF4215 domain-containing protein n=1 Tax=Nannocystis bainbridge TaxID=2995303 RepID=A0ABT5DR03_9BACT|nr:DUF4215 domain-containing protein [Nannocystis bainbridge]MDC0716029.1 DUF4215 domain-containing protein [Nannocystis bainbridge]
MRFTFLNALNIHRNLLLVGALLGASAAACDPKQIGDETSGNLTCQNGETKPSEDGCNTCTCEGGDWSCTLKACDDGCEDGETKPAQDGCNTCTCTEGGWACTEIACEGLECEEGETKPAEDGCNTCTCYGGDWACTEIGCEETEGTGTDGEPNETEGSSTTSASVCGDGVVEGDEVCDDSNTVSGDGCSSECTIEGALACSDPAPADPYQVLDAAIVGDALKVEIQYGGGCAEHDFALCWDGLFAESEPVQVGLEISHDANGDLCDAAPTVSLEFSLADLKASYQAGYQTQSGQISIGLDGWNQNLLYAF